MKTVDGKLVMLGQSGVGKTSLIIRYINKTHSNSTKETIGASFFTCNINLSDARVKLQIWDTAGQERFKSMTPMYYRNANVAFLVFDLTNNSSFVAVKSWVNELKGNIDYTMLFVIIGNKNDLEVERKIAYNEAQEYASSIGASYYETSALRDEGIDRVFLNTAKDLLIMSSGDKNKIENLCINDFDNSDITNQDGSQVPSSEECMLNASIADGIKERTYCC